ncbi:hypothetical protein H8958_008636 [Nasalis larvatus]
MSASQLEALCPQVVNAALALGQPQSKLAQENMDLFKEQWEKQVCVVTDAVDDVTSIDDFLAVSENHILENVSKCVVALQEKDVDGLDHTAGAIQGRAARGIHVVSSEMNNYELGVQNQRRFWKPIKAPEEKPLVKREKQDETQTKIKWASQKKHVNPVQALSEFKAMDSI